MDEYAKLAFSKGIRAVYSEGEPEFSNLEGKQIPWSSLDNWLAIRQYQLIKEEASATWKDRHAKGVPVKMSVDDFYDLYPGYKDRVAGHVYSLDARYSMPGEPGTPIILVVNSVHRRIASFCNFRYKPEWLEKKQIPNHFDNRLKTILI